jgi:hypothetical protein
MGHALFSPSASHRWLRCPGSVRLSEGLTSPETVYSRRGTFGHEMAAACLTLGVPAEHFRGHSDGEFVFDDELVAAVQVYLDVVNELVRSGPGGQLFVEHRVHVTEDCYGTADAIVIGHDAIHIVDLKLGAGSYVEVEGNTQLLTYAAGAREQFGEAVRALPAKLHVVQPLFDGAAPHRTAVALVSEVITHASDIVVAQRDALSEKPTLSAGEHCRYCPAAATCPALRDQAFTAVEEMFPDRSPGQLPTKVTAPPLPEQIPSERLGQVLALADTVEQWIEAVRKEAFARASRGDQIPGMKLVARIGNRQWDNETRAAAVLRGLGFDPFEARLRSPAQAEKLGPKAKAAVAELTHRPTTGVSLVPDSDRRPALTREEWFPLLTGGAT